VSMKTIIAGSRDGVRFQDVEKAMEICGWVPTEVVSGKARGVDTMGERWSYERQIPIIDFPADWDEHGKSAGYIRNTEMGDYAEALVAIWDGGSRGTMHMINIAKKKGLTVYVHDLNKDTYDKKN